MPRQARIKSQTGIYHVLLKGIDDRDIFLDDHDRNKFIEQIIKAREKSKFALLAYCLMDNHVHLLIEEDEEIGAIIKRITVGYVLWHNNKYGRSGHLFRNRFGSEEIENDNYLLNVVRYIHSNPVKAGIVKHPADYNWSSYQQYIAAYRHSTALVNCERIKLYFQTEKDYVDFMNVSANDECLGYKPSTKFLDEELRKIILLQKVNIGTIKNMPQNERNRAIRDIHQMTGASIRQLGRVLGIGKGIVQRGLESFKEDL